MPSPKQKSQQIWKITDELKAHLTDMLQNAGFKEPALINKMINRICTSKTKTSQGIMSRWMNNRTENGMKKWMDDFLFAFRSSGMTREELIEVLSANPTMFFSKVETLHQHASKFQEKLKSEGIFLPDTVAFNKLMFQVGIFSRSSTTVARNIKNLKKVFERRGVVVDAEVFVKKALKTCPALFMQRPSTIASNIDETVKTLRRSGYPITSHQYAKVCYSQLRLSYRCPETICKNFERIYAFIEQEHCRLAVDARKDIKTPQNIVQKILADPAHLGCGEETLNNRWLLACQMEEEKGFPATYTQVTEVKSAQLQRRLTNYRCPFQRAVDALRQKD